MDFEYEISMNFFYDMAMPLVQVIKPFIGRLDESLKLQDSSNFTRETRDSNLDLLYRCLESLSRDGFESPYKEEALVWLRVFNLVKSAETMPQRMEAIMTWAVHDPEAHIRLLFSLFYDGFEKRKTQIFPSMRVKIPSSFYKDSREQAIRYHRLFDEGWQYVEEGYQENLNKNRGYCRDTIQNYRDFLLIVWLRYLSEHSDMFNRAANYLERCRGHISKDTYHDFAAAIGLNIVKVDDGRVYFARDDPRGC